MSGKPFNMVAPADYRFWELLTKVVQDEPTDAVDATTLGFWASVGIKKGKPFAPDARMKKILTEAAVVGDATARAIMYRWRGARKATGTRTTKSDWRLGFIGGYKFEENGARVLNGYSAFFFYATGVTPAMDIAGRRRGLAVHGNVRRRQGQCARRRQELQAAPAARTSRSSNFWSVIVYDNQTRSMLQTDQRFPSVSSQNRS